MTRPIGVDAATLRIDDLERSLAQLWREVKAPTLLKEIGDITLGTIADGAALTYDGAVGRWKAGTASASNYYVNGGDHGMPGDDSTDETSHFTAAISATPHGGALFIPPGVHLTDPIVCDKAITLFSVGRFSCWLKPTSNYSDAVLTFDLPATPPLGSTRGWYGGGVRDLGFDLYSAGNATGLHFAYSTAGGGWMSAVGCYLGGGSVSIENDMPNNWIEDCILFDAGKFFVIDGETGLELTLRDIAMGRNTAGTTTCGIEVLCANTTSIKGALMMQNVRLATGYVSGSVETHMGMKVAATKASGGDPESVSVPVFADGVILDNIEGPGLVLERVRDVHYDNGWINSAAGGPCVQIQGGGNHSFRGNDYFGGDDGGGTKTYDFVSGAGSCDGFTSKDNFCPTNTVYFLPATDKPVNMHLDDRCILSTGVGPLAITNDVDGLYAAATWSIGSHKHNDRLGVAVPMVFDENELVSGFATLVAGTVAVTCPHADSTFSQVIAFHRTPGGTTGQLYIAGVTTGTGFTISSTSATDTSLVGWLMFRRA